MQKIKQKQTTSSCAVTDADAGAGVEAEAEAETKRFFQLMALEMPKGAGHVALSFSLLLARLSLELARAYVMTVTSRADVSIPSRAGGKGQAKEC